VKVHLEHVPALAHIVRYGTSRRELEHAAEYYASAPSAHSLNRLRAAAAAAVAETKGFLSHQPRVAAHAAFANIFSEQV
jgi:hypothetical protein